MKKRKVYSSFKDNIWDVDLADMQLISKYNKKMTYLLCVIDLFSKYILIYPNKWVDQGSEFYNNNFKT